ncbi:MAG: hypothetical protein MAG453_00409 [Calditrichaeota bacterium]|nr:hypothetical protein [Calditrichota bacterium]
MTPFKSEFARSNMPVLACQARLIDRCMTTIQLYDYP